MRYLLAMMLPLGLSGCMLELLTTTAIQGELAAKDAQAGVAALNSVKESTAKIEARSAIQAYQADTGKLPPSLAALVPGYLPKVPMHPDGTPYGYDPVTGAVYDTVAAAPQRVPFTEEDGKNIKRIEDAIYSYWKATRNYPSSLADLQPLYMDKVPTLSSGAQYIYNPQTGAVNHPSDFQPATGAPHAGRIAAPAGGAGPLGEVSGGIAIQNQLRNMNTSGTQAVNGTARRGLGAIQGAHNQQQQNALNQIDQ